MHKELGKRVLGNCADDLLVVKALTVRAVLPTSETARHQDLFCDCFVSDFRVAFLSSCTAVAEKKNLQA